MIAVKNTAQWSDYVFEKDYHLKSIEEVEAFVKKNKHLPNVPSAKEIVEGGIHLGKMDAILLRQIEELWLHMMEMEKRLQHKEKENKILKAFIKQALEK